MRRFWCRLMYGKRIGAGTWSRDGLRFRFDAVFRIGYRMGRLHSVKEAPAPDLIRAIHDDSDRAWNLFTGAEK